MRGINPKLEKYRELKAERKKLQNELDRLEVKK